MGKVIQAVLWGGALMDAEKTCCSSRMAGSRSFFSGIPAWRFPFTLKVEGDAVESASKVVKGAHARRKRIKRFLLIR